MTKQLKPKAKVNKEQIRNNTRKKKKKIWINSDSLRLHNRQHYLMPCQPVTGRVYWVKSNWEKNMIDVISYKCSSLCLLVHGVWCKWQWLSSKPECPVLNTEKHCTQTVITAAAWLRSERMTSVMKKVSHHHHGAQTQTPSSLSVSR